ncbi:hypothetical protein LZ30DRAFT_778270 [Colletotrichum cereale]|nr:hypothetical protein LZ30DRAFT_778270 [Colletotrichum cereale]
MDTQDLSTSISRTACKAATSNSASWTARTLSRVAGKLSHRYLSCHAQVLTQDRDCEPIIEFQPTFQTQGSLKRGHRQQGLSFTDLDTWAFDNEGCDLLRCGDDVFLENGGADGYGYYDYEDETHFSQDETSEAVYDDLPDFLDEETPKLTLTTPESEIIIGDAIPEGTKCYFSDEYHAFQRQRLDTLENSLVSGNWKQIRDLNRPQEPEADYAEERPYASRRGSRNAAQKGRSAGRATRNASDAATRQSRRSARGSYRE